MVLRFSITIATEPRISSSQTAPRWVNPHPGRHLPQLYHNDGHGHFTDVAAHAGFTTEGWGQGVCVGDYDNDGWPDLLVTYYGHNRLYRNLGDGTFRDVTAQAKLPVDGIRFGSGCSFVDYDRDGLLDLFIANYVDLDLSKTPKPGDGAFCVWKEIPVMCGPRGLPLAHNILYHNNGDGTFTDVSEKAGILSPGGRYSLGVAAADFANDGWPDIYVACDMTPSLLFRNKHDGTFEERGVAAGVAYNFDGNLQAGMGVAVADFDGDGLLDIAKTNFSGDLTSLFRNEDGKFFTDVSRSAGLGSRQFLGWGIAFVDVDDDGWHDLVIANGHVYPEVENKPIGDKYLEPTLLFRNQGNGRFVELGAAAGPAFEVPRPAQRTCRRRSGRRRAARDRDRQHESHALAAAQSKPRRELPQRRGFRNKIQPQRHRSQDYRYRRRPQEGERSDERRQLLFAKQSGVALRFGKRLYAWTNSRSGGPADWCRSGALWP